MKDLDNAISQHEFMDRVHQANFEMLSYVQPLCMENGIEFYLWVGTRLGVIRHNDFIPWEDDADIVMFETDYLKL